MKFSLFIDLAQSCLGLFKHFFVYREVSIRIQIGTQVMWVNLAAFLSIN